ncbi:hypothetical protein [Nocardia fluminea]
MLSSTFLDNDSPYSGIPQGTHSGPGRAVTAGPEADAGTCQRALRAA